MKVPPLFTRASWESKRHALVDGAASRARALPFLSPDASMQSLSTEARSLVTDCANEAWALAFAPLVAREDRFQTLSSLRDGLATPDCIALDGEHLYEREDRGLDDACAANREHEPSTIITRSMRHACSRWKSARQHNALRSPLAMAKARLDQALLDHAGLSVALHAALRGPYTSDAQRNGQRMSAGFAPFSVSAHECIVDDVLWKIAFESPSPFAVQLRLWERGVWPVWTEDKTLIVYVPVLGEDGLAMSEEDNARAIAPRSSELFADERCALEDQPPCALDEVIVYARNYAALRVALARNAEVIDVGRSRDCAISIQQDTLARRHCTLLWSDSSWMIRDNNSTSGTYVDGELCRAARVLSGGEVIQAGRVWLWFIGSRG